MLRPLKQRLKRALYAMRGLRPDIQIPVDTLNPGHQAWYLAKNSLVPGDVAYSLGLADNIAFDLELIAKFQVELHGFDPTPESQAYLSTCQLPATMHVHAVAIAGHEEGLLFKRPVAGCAGAHIDPGAEGASYRVPSQRLSTIMRELGHDRLALLKMDIEGSEYEVIDDIVEQQLQIDQILVEFHHRFRGIGLGRTREAVRRLRQAGYRIFHVSPWCEEYAFIKNGAVPDAPRR